MDHDSAAGTPTPFVIHRDLQCIGCGYNLRSRSLDQVCPECGTPVERSTLILPKPETTAKAVRLAAWALLIGLLTGCVNLELIGSIVMMVAIFRLYYRCDLGHMPRLGQSIKWLWITTVVANIGNAIGAVMALIMVGGLMVSGSFNFARSNARGNITTAQTAEGQVTTTLHSTTGLKIEAVDDPDGARIVRVTPTGGTATTLIEEQPVTLPAPDGSSQVVTLEADGTVSVVGADYTDYEIDPGTGAVVRTTAGPAVGVPVVLGWLATIAGIAAVFLYLVVCRELAFRARSERLVKQFRTLMWMMIIGGAGVLIGGAIAVAGLARGGLIPLIGLAALGVLLWFVASIWQITASFRLSNVLREVPRTLDEAIGPA